MDASYLCPFSVPTGATFHRSLSRRQRVGVALRQERDVRMLERAYLPLTAREHR
jgi:hypothetical protein